MNKIRLLPPEEALKIAAGEVIERPAHIVKELVENALDAGATTISLYVEKSGKELLRLVDNGCGMNAADAQACFLPHATSKITHLDDLNHITSFGFRGEALASIAAISHVTLTTKSDDSSHDDLGITIEYSESKTITQSSVNCPVGTDLIVRNLFFNTPVRKKFLKQDETEFNAIQSIFHAFCLSNPMVTFKLFHDDKLMLNAPGVQNIRDRATQIWDFNVAQNLIPLIDDPTVNGVQEKPPFSVNGFISHHNFWRYGRNFIHFFVNKRWVKNSELSKALLKGYLNVLPPGRFPMGLIYISIDQESIDVNVHPKKEEVRFSKPGTVSSCLTMLVKKTLEQHLSSLISTRREQLPIEPHSSVIPEKSHADFAPFFNFEPSQSYTRAQPTTLPCPQISSTSNQEQQVLTNHCEPKIIGHLFNTYIIMEKENEVVLIDQHAAHERILYEKIKSNFLAQQGTFLIFPEIITLTPQQRMALATIQESLEKQGISFDLVGSNEIAVRSCPPQLKGSDLKDFILNMTQFAHEHENLDSALFHTTFNEHLHAQIACKSAIKAGDVLSLDQMKQLINDLEKAENRFICVHGRPTTWTIAKTHLEKQFRRS